MTNKKTSTKQDKTIAVEQVYYLPDFGVSVTASSVEEAADKAHQQLNSDKE